MSPAWLGAPLLSLCLWWACSLPMGLSVSQAHKRCSSRSKDTSLQALVFYWIGTRHEEAQQAGTDGPPPAATPGTAS